MILIAGACIQGFAYSGPEGDDRSMFIVGRFLTGFGIATCQTAGPSYVAEMSHPAWRGVLTGLYNCQFFVGGVRDTNPPPTPIFVLVSQNGHPLTNTLFRYILDHRDLDHVANLNNPIGNILEAPFVASVCSCGFDYGRGYFHPRDTPLVVLQRPTRRGNPSPH